MQPSMPSDYSTWAGQYVLSAEPADIDGWVGRRVAGRHLTAHPALPVILVTVGGEEVGQRRGRVVVTGGQTGERVFANGALGELARGSY